VDAGCPVCRAYRDQHHVTGPDWSALTVPLLAVVLALALILALHLRFG
jgi:hypothetical protein